MARLIAAAAAALVLLGTTPASAAEPELLFKITDPRIDEASGIAVGRTSPGVVYVQNDSGDTNRFFALDRRSGKTAAVVTVPGAQNQDWEDLAVAPDSDGRSSVWIADTGVNTVRRTELRVYRIPEPEIDPDGRDVAVQSAAPDVWRLRFPEGRPRNTESLAVTPDGIGFLITKSRTGDSDVYRMPPQPDADRVQTLTRVAKIKFGPTDSPNPFGLAGQLTATGAAISRDGRLLAVRTYADAYVWQVRGGRIADALRTDPARVSMPPKEMGEGITFADGRLLVDSEGVDEGVYSLPIPVSTPTPSPSSSGSSSGSASPSGTADRDGSSGSTAAVIAAIAGGVVLVAVVVALIAARRRRRPAVHGPGSSAG